MKTITAPERSTELLRAGQVMTITGRALVEWFSEGGVKKGPIAVNGSWDVGPFGSDVQLVISALAGAVSFGAGEVDVEALVSYVDISNIRTTPVRIATFGDSTADFGRLKPTTDVNVKDISTDKVVSVQWQSGLASTAMTADKMQVNHLYPMAYPVANAGISGQTPAQMITRDLDTYSVSRRAIADVIAQMPDVVFYRGGGINALLGATTATKEALFVSVYNDHIEALNRMTTCGVPIIDIGIFGFSATTTDITVTRELIVRLNAAYKAFAENSAGKIIFIETSGVLHDGTGAFLPNMSHDGTHLGFNGSYQLAIKEAAILVGLFGKSSGPRYPGYNNFSNELFLATGSQSFGTLATNISIQASSATRQNAKIETIDGIKYQTCEFVTTAAGNGKILITFDPSSAGAGLKAPLGIVNGDTYGLELNYYVEPLSGNIPAILYLRIDIRDNIGSGRLVCDLLPGQSFTLDRVIKQKAVFPPIVFGDDQANLLNTTSLTFTLDTTVVGAVFKLGIGGHRLVKL